MASPSNSVMSTGGFPQEISRDYKKIFFDEFSRQPTEYTEVANITTMDGAYDREGQLVGLSAMTQLGEGQAVPLDSFLPGNSKYVYPDDFGLAVAFTENMLDDDQSGHMKKGMQELAKAAALTRELKFWDLLNSGFVTTKRTTFDGAALFASHTLLSGDSYSNLGAAGALSMSTLQAAYNVFEKMPNERGNPRPVQPKLVIVGADLRFDAEMLLKSEYNPENANGQVNTVGNKGVQFMVCHYLSSTTAWFLVGQKSDHDLRFINRKALKFDTWPERSKRIQVYQATMRIQSHVANWYGVMGNAGA